MARKPMFTRKRRLNFEWLDEDVRRGLAETGLKQGGRSFEKWHLPPKRNVLYQRKNLERVSEELHAELTKMLGAHALQVKGLIENVRIKSKQSRERKKRKVERTRKTTPHRYPGGHPAGYINDIIGARIVAPNTMGCYKAAHNIMSHFNLKKKDLLKFFDFFLAPKSTGYRAIHLSFLYQGIPVEIQITSWERFIANPASYGTYLKAQHKTKKWYW